MILISSIIRSSRMAVVFSMTELMLMGFISLLLTVGQSLISKICVPKSVGDSWHPCKPGEESATTSADGHSQDSSTNGRRLLQDSVSAGVFRRILAGGGGSDKCAAKVRFPLSDLYISIVNVGSLTPRTDKEHKIKGNIFPGFCHLCFFFLIQLPAFWMIRTNNRL